MATPPALVEQLDRVFVEAYEQLLHWLMTRVAGTGISAEDILHTTYLKLRRTNPPDGFHRSYLFFAANSVMIDALRREKWIVPLKDRHRVYDSIDERSYDLDDQLACIPPRHRIALELTCGGYAHHEIAVILGVSPKASKTILHRARRDIKRLATEGASKQVAQAV